MQKLTRKLSLVMVALMTVFTALSYVPAKAATVVPQVQFVGEQKTEFTAGERITFNLNAANYGGRVQYRVVLWNDTTKSYSDLWNTGDKYYANWMPYGNETLPLGWVINEPGSYRITIYAKRAGLANSKTALKGSNCDSFLNGKAFTVKPAAVTPESIAPVADVTVNEGETPVLPTEVTLNLADKTTKTAKVTWAAVDTTKVGTVAVAGTVEGTDKKATVNVIVKAVALGVKEVSALNFAELKVVFNTAIDEDSIDFANIKVDGLALNGNVNNDYKLSADGKELVVYNYNKFATQQQQKRKISISGIKSVGGQEMTAIVNQDVTFTDTQIPQLVSVALVGNKKLVLNFSEAIDYNLAGTAYNSNYRVDNKVVTGVGAPEIEWNKVTITLASPLTTGEHTVTFVNGTVRDFALYVAVPTELKFTVAEDTAKPTVEVVSAYQEKATLKFSKEIDTTVAKVYWMDGYTKKSATLSKPYADKTTVVATFGTTNYLPLIPTDVIVENAKDYYGNVMDKTTLKITANADIERPTVLSVEPDTNNKEGLMVITFSEKVDIASARVWGNLVIKNAKGTALTIPSGNINYVTDSYGYNVTTKIKVAGTFTSANGPYTVTIKNVTDLSVYANKLVEQTFTVTTPDVTIPQISSVGLNKANRQIIIAFGEAMDASSLANLANYTYSYGAGNDQYASIPAGTFVDISSNGKVVTLTFPATWVLEGTNTTFTHFDTARNIMIKDVADVAGNAIPVAVRNLTASNYTEIAAAVTNVYALDANTLRLYLDANVLPAEVYAGDFVVKTASTNVALTVTNASLNTTSKYITLTIAEDLTADAKYEVTTNVFEAVNVTTVASIALTKTAMGTPITAISPAKVVGDYFSPSLKLATTGAYAGMLIVTNNTVQIPFDESIAAIVSGSDAAKSFRVKDYNGYLLTEGTDYSITATAGDTYATLTLLKAGYNNILTVQLNNNLYVTDNSGEGNTVNDFEPVVTSLPVLAPAAAAAPTVTFGTAVAAGKVLLSGTTTAMEYKVNAGTWTPCIVNMEVAANIGDTIAVRTAGTPFVIASASTTLTVASANITAAAAPAVTTAAATITTGSTKISGLTSGITYEYIMDTTATAPADWTTAVSLTAVAADQDEVVAGANTFLHIRVKATAQQPASLVTDTAIVAKP